MISAQLVTSFIASAGFGIIFNVPKRSIIQSGLVGMLGWICYYSLTTYGLDVVPATIFGAVLVSILSYTCAKIYKTPIIIFTVSGIIPLVPGGVAYRAMRQFVENNYDLAIQLSAQVMLLAGGIAIGLMFSEVVNQIVKKVFIRKD
ncbi:threonine/serine exporter family protein [Oceanobacillus caeni]|nr:MULTISPECIES: threonine/serine exporter family protein [Bacillaceae]PZD83371.1 threonine/serine exporter [Bacilli bacterium]MBU8789950.1 threonine/serine exporter family protein [Oceanobacillus caeni]MCR1834317.1 threonine/serine exporter family protein [Oceanobacillus caeni]MED4475419.1 threonine/serine exporter family protein [Oceanobacillus caeni]PZD84504.1 threonine/serine exporter [Bacilli bacterium]